MEGLSGGAPKLKSATLPETDSFLSVPWLPTSSACRNSCTPVRGVGSGSVSGRVASE